MMRQHGPSLQTCCDASAVLLNCTISSTHYVSSFSVVPTLSTSSRKVIDDLPYGRFKLTIMRLTGKDEKEILVTWISLPFSIYAHSSTLTDPWRLLAYAPSSSLVTLHESNTESISSFQHLWHSCGIRSLPKWNPSLHNLPLPWKFENIHKSPKKEPNLGCSTTTPKFEASSLDGEYADHSRYVVAFASQRRNAGMSDVSDDCPDLVRSTSSCLRSA